MIHTHRAVTADLTGIYNKKKKFCLNEKFDCIQFCVSYSRNISLVELSFNISFSKKSRKCENYKHDFVAVLFNLYQR